MSWKARALLLIARTALRCEQHLMKLDRDGSLGIKTEKNVSMFNDERVRLKGLADEA
jgi:hypothetical protein